MHCSLWDGSSDCQRSTLLRRPRTRGASYPSRWSGTLDRLTNSRAAHRSGPQLLILPFFTIPQWSCFIVLRAPHSYQARLAGVIVSVYLHWLFRLSLPAQLPACYLRTPHMFAELCSSWGRFTRRIKAMVPRATDFCCPKPSLSCYALCMPVEEEICYLMMAAMTLITWLLSSAGLKRAIHSAAPTPVHLTASCSCCEVCCYWVRGVLP